MGTMRLVFSLFVAVFHAYPKADYVAAVVDLAIPIFFILSGFHITMALWDKYKYKEGSLRLFALNRLLRIYPIYWTILLMAVVLPLLKTAVHFGGIDNSLKSYFHYNLLAKIISNITLVFTADLWEKNTGGYLVGPQVWYLQVELLFYLVSPLVLWIKRRRALPLIVVAILLMQWLRIPSNLFLKNTLFNLFFDNLKNFFMGIAAYFIYKSVKFPSIHPLRIVSIFIFCITAVALFRLRNNAFVFACSILFALSLPLVYNAFRNIHWDIILSRLSYPVFISHFVIIRMVNHFVPTRNYAIYIPLMISSTLFFSFFVYRLIDIPVDKFRQKQVSSCSPHNKSG